MLYDRLNAEVKKGLNDELELYPTVNGGVIKSLKEKKGIGQLTLEEVFAIKAYSKLVNKSNGLRYHTSGGSKEYTGGRLWISDINLDICSTDTYYSWNTWSYVEKILNYINEKINLK